MDFNEIARAFDKPVGYYIQGDDELRQWKPSVLSFGYSFANVEPRLILDSEQPRLELCNGATHPTTLDGLLRRHLVLEAKVFRLYRKHPASEELRVLPRWLEVFNGIKPPIVW
ncbi:hypothetical protein NUH16_010124 [Penicillium rubens]|nr:hypothetical protein NUH16_010124 [Penicillium rubens]